ncbi:MAG: bifunctional riboflavin kinase/FAD synthetase [Chitinophagales bacterium]
MRLYRGEEARNLRWAAEAPVLALGFFDGVHRGHQALVRRAVADARRAGAPAGVLTFEPHPLAVLRPERPPDLLTTLEEKAALLAGLKLDFTVAYPFSRELAALAPERFVSEVLCGQFRVREVVVGYNFTFGAGGRGHYALLSGQGCAHGFTTVLIPPVTLKRRAVSSTAVRERLLAGRVEEAEELLGHPYLVSGQVRHGAGRGRRLGFPTANVASPEGKLLPGDGVYFVSVDLGGETWPGVASVSDNPTFAGGERQLEVHLLAFEGDLYAQTVTVRFRRWLRGIQRFASAEELSAQVARDRAEAERLWTGEAAASAPAEVSG